MADNGFLNGFNNNFWNPVDFLLPGYSAINNMFDLKGEQAANNQFASQLALQQQAQAFNSAEADKSRQWQEMMDNSSIQRRVADLKAAGLNPYLAITGSLAGAGSPSGSSASSSSGSADMANNKIAAAAGVIALVLRVLLAKH